MDFRLVRRVGSKLSPFQPNPKGKGGDEKGKGKGKKEPRARSQSASKGAKATKDTVCYNCNKKGHFARDCWHRNETRMRKIILMVAKLKGKQSRSLRVDRRITPKEKGKARLLPRLPTTKKELT